MLRQKNMETRRQHALDAAESLIRKTARTDFTMVALAELAGLSPATPYNLFGSKSALMYALLNRCLDQIFAGGDQSASESDPYLRVLRRVDTVADLFLSDPDFFRPLMQFLLGVSDPVHRPAYMERALDYWKRSVSGLVEAGSLSPEIDENELSRELLIHIVGVLDLWVQRELEGEAFRGQVLYGAALLLLAVAEGADREKLFARIRQYKRKLPKAFSFLPRSSRQPAG